MASQAVKATTDYLAYMPMLKALEAYCMALWPNNYYATIPWHWLKPNAMPYGNGIMPYAYGHVSIGQWAMHLRPKGL